MQSWKYRGLPEHHLRRVCAAIMTAGIALSSCTRKVIWPASRVEVSDPKTSKQVIYGFYDAIGNSWRWTGPEFMVALGIPLKNGKPQSDTGPAYLHLQLYFPPDEIPRLGPVTLSASSPGFKYRDVTFTAGGPQEYVSPVPAAALKTNLLPVRFTLDRYLHGSGADNRDLGVVVSSVALTTKN